MPFQKVILRAMHPDEALELHDAYKKWGSPYVLPRSTDDLMRAAKNGLAFMLESEAGLVGATGVFDLREDEYVESGATFVDEALRGYGIQNLFFEVRNAAIALNYGVSIKFTTAIDPTNKPSLANTLKNCFERMDHIPEQVGSACSNCKKLELCIAPRVCCCDFYLLPTAGSRTLAQRLLDRVSVDGKALLTHKEKASIDLEVRLRVVTDEDTRAALGEFANGADW